jgi:putative ABC transport system permease protein
MRGCSGTPWCPTPCWRSIGVVFAWAAVATVPNLVFAVPWGLLALCGVAAGLLGLLASLVPARRAARMSPVAALATE